MSLRLCFILFLFTSPLYASCHNDVIDAAANASYVHKIQQVTASDRVYLYSAPNVQCRLNTFLVNGDPVQVFREATEYRDPHSTRHSVPQQYNYISFRDAQGLFVTGWVQASQLLDVASPLNAPISCQKQSDIAFQGQEALHVSHEKNHYQVSGARHAWFYSAPSPECINKKIFVIPGDRVSVQRQIIKNGVSYATYYAQDRQIIQGWLKTDQLVAKNSGDQFRDNVDTDSAAKAARILSLFMSLQGQCHFYESTEDSDKDDTFDFPIREDHQSEGCIGAGDPETAPVVGRLYINKKTARVYIDDPEDDDKKIEVEY